MGTEIYIDDAVKNRARHKGIKLPSQYDREHLQRGDFAKVIFACSPGRQTERMWLRVTNGRGTSGDYVGRLDNQPALEPFTHHKLGESFTFGPENVIQIVRNTKTKTAGSAAPKARKKRGGKKTATKAPSRPRKARKTAPKRSPAKRRKAARKAKPAAAPRPSKPTRTKRAPAKRASKAKKAPSAPKTARKRSKKRRARKSKA